MIIPIICVIICAMLAGCAGLPHTIEHRKVGSRTIEIHTDAPAELEPAGCREPWAACYEISTRRIFMRSPLVGPGDLEHELAHDAGMRHGPWVLYDFLRMRCAQVTAAGGKYRVGQMICKRGRGEEVFADATFSKLAKDGS